MPIVFKSGSLNLLEPSGPVQACNGIALPLPLPLVFLLWLIPKTVYDNQKFRKNAPISHHLLFVPSNKTGVNGSCRVLLIVSHISFAHQMNYFYDFLNYNNEIATRNHSWH